MDIKKIEETYSKGKYRELIDMVNENSSVLSIDHVINLYVRSASKMGIRVDDNKIPETFRNNLDYKWNIFQHEDKKENEWNEMLMKLIVDGREELIEDAVIIYLDKFEHMPINNNLIDYCADNAERPVVIKYLEIVADSADDMEKLIIFRILKRENSRLLRNIKTNYPMIDSIYKKYIETDCSSLSISEFKRALKFRKGMFIIIDTKIMEILDLDNEKKQFVLRTKTGTIQMLDFEKVLEKTHPIEENDFRVYKFFRPEAAKELSPCELLKSIIMYNGNAVDRETLKKELIYIYGTDALKYISKNKKTFEQCSGIHVIFGKSERYLLSDDAESSTVAHIKRIKDAVKVRDYLISTIKSTELSGEDIIKISELIQSFREPLKSEIMFLLNKDNKYAEQVYNNDLSEIASEEFIETIVNTRAANGLYANEHLLIQLNENAMNRIYNASNSRHKEIMIESVEKSIRLGTNLMFIQWFISKQPDAEITLESSFVHQRILNIANEIAALKKSDPFIAFVRKHYFTGKKPKIVDLVKSFSKKDAKELYDVFMKLTFLSSYQKDEARIKIYEIYPDFRKLKKIEYEYSTHRGIDKKQDELNHIINEVLPELTVKIREAADHGDLSENAEYKYSREQYRFMSIMANELGRELSNAHPADLSHVTGDSVDIGTIITIQMIKENETKRYSILGPLDVDDEKGIISYRSPLVQKLMGMKAGESKDNFLIKSISKITEDI